MKIRNFILMLIIFSSPTFADNLHLTDPKLPIVISPAADHFTINLKANPSTGYSWRLKKYDAHLFKPVRETYKAPPKELVGAPGIESFDFKVEKDTYVIKRISHIVFVYMKPWSLETAEKVTFNIVTNNS